MDQFSTTGIGGKSYIRLSFLFQVCAYLYETGAVLGQAKHNFLPELLKLSLSDKQDGVLELQSSLARRLETSAKYKSLYTFYLHNSLRDMDMEFDLRSMKAAHKIVRATAETGNFLDNAGVEGLLLGASFPDLTKKMYRKGYDLKHRVISEMTRYGVIFPKETVIKGIKDRENIVLNKVKAYASEHNIAFGVLDNYR